MVIDVSRHKLTECISSASVCHGNAIAELFDPIYPQVLCLSILRPWHLLIECFYLVAALRCEERNYDIFSKLLSTSKSCTGTPWEHAYPYQYVQQRVRDVLPNETTTKRGFNFCYGGSTCEGARTSVLSSR